MPCWFLLPGMDGTGWLFDRLVAAIGDEAQVVVARYPTNAPLDYEALRSLVREQAPTTPHWVLGESFSGPLSVWHASDNASVRGVLLCASFLRSPVPTGIGSLAGWAVGWAPTVPPSPAIQAAMLGGDGDAALLAEVRELDAGHLVAQTHPEATWEVMRTFADTLPR